MREREREREICGQKSDLHNAIKNLTLLLMEVNSSSSDKSDREKESKIEYSSNTEFISEFMLKQFTILKTSAP